MLIKTTITERGNFGIKIFIFGGINVSVLCRTQRQALKVT